MTPTPMVFSRERDETYGLYDASGCAPTPPDPLVLPRCAGREATRDAISGRDHGDLQAGSAPRFSSYHPPRPPPESIVPPVPPASFSVATEYDPKAPTRPKLRRRSSLPAAPLLFGLDRMLVWGLLLGGLFVAMTIVLVRRVVFPVEPSLTERTEPSVAASRLSTVVERNATDRSSEAEQKPSGDAGVGAAPSSKTPAPSPARVRAARRPGQSMNSEGRGLWIE